MERLELWRHGIALPVDTYEGACISGMPAGTATAEMCGDNCGTVFLLIWDGTDCDLGEESGSFSVFSASLFLAIPPSLRP